MYDTDASGAAAPFTEFVSPAKARRLFGRFEDVEIAIRNFDDLTFRRKRLLSRDRILGTPLERLLGLDLYIVGRRLQRSRAGELS